MDIILNNNIVNPTLNSERVTPTAGEELSNNNYPPIELPELPNSPTIKYTNIYNVDLDKFNISNDLTNATETTNGINNSMIWAKSNNYNGIKLPEGKYLIDTEVINPILIEDKNNNDKWYHNRCGIYLQNNFILDITGCILKALPCANPYTNILTISCCSNVKIIGGTIIGDKLTHKYGHLINLKGDELEEGGIDDSTGELIPDTTNGYIRTKDYIEEINFADGTIGPLPTQFHIVPIINTRFNTTDGGRCFVYCYDANNHFLGKVSANGWGGYCNFLTLLNNTKRIKIKFWKESGYLNGIYAISQEKIYRTFEFNSGILLTNCSLIEINGVAIRNCVGDCIYTFAPPISTEVSDLSIINCTLESSRRQGISFVSNGLRYLIKNSNIGNIQGIDPQSGIDIEHYDYVKGVTLDNVNFYGNRKFDFINFNGTTIQVKNCTLSSSLGATYGNTMDIRNNKLVYNGLLTDNNRPNLSINTTDNRIYNNYIYNYIVSCENESSYAYCNKYIQSKVLISRNDPTNLYNNCDITFSNNILTYISNLTFNDCKTSIKDDSNSLTIESCTFNNSSFLYRVKPILKNCKIVLKDKSFFDAWMPESRSCTLLNCNIVAYESIIKNNSNVMLTFENCNITTIRKPFINYGTITFKNCVINLTDDGSPENITWNSYSKCYFYNCTINSSKLTKVEIFNKLDNNTITNSNIIFI